MAFIDIFNFKKYFSKPSDAQVARIGHVNAVYDALSSGSITEIPTIIVSAEADSITLTAEKCILDMRYTFSAMSFPVQYNIYYPGLNENSIIRATMIQGYTQAVAARDISLIVYQYAVDGTAAVYASDGPVDPESGDIVKFLIEIIRL